MEKIKIALVCDVEGLLFLEQGNPSYKGIQKLKFAVNKHLLAPQRYTKKGYETVHYFCYEKKLPITFMITLNLFKPMRMEHDWIEFGSHTWNHKPLTLCNQKELNKELHNPYDMVSITPPMWLTEEGKRNNYIFDNIYTNGFKVCTYRGISKDNKAELLYCREPIDRGKLKVVYVSAVYDKESHLKKIKEDLKKNYSEDSIYLISTHDFVHKDTKKLEKLYEVIKNFKCICLRDVVR